MSIIHLCIAYAAIGCVLLGFFTHSANAGDDDPFFTISLAAFWPITLLVFIGWGIAECLKQAGLS